MRGEAMTGKTPICTVIQQDRRSAFEVLLISSHTCYGFPRT